jgi:hypothetical protein
MPDGVMAVGFADITNEDDWKDVPAKGSYDQIMIRYDHNGKIIFKKCFGGNGTDRCYGATLVPDGIVSVGNSDAAAFGNGDWTGGDTAKGYEDATIVKHFLFFPVTHLTGVPNTARAGTPLPLTATVHPSNATRKTIVWGIADAGTTGAMLGANTLMATATGTVKLAAIIINGGTLETTFTQDFIVTVLPDTNPPSPCDTAEMVALRLENLSLKSEIFLLKDTISDLKQLLDDCLKGVSVPSIVQKEFKIYPNPTTGLLTIEKANGGIERIDIFEITGKFLQTTIVNQQSTIVLDISHLANGMYYLKIDNVVVKVVKN